MNNRFRMMLLAAAGLLATSGARAASYVYTDLNGVDVTQGSAINSNNVAALYGLNLITNTPEVLTYNPATKSLERTSPPPSTTLAFVRGINKAGKVLAEFSTPKGEGLYTYNPTTSVDRIVSVPKSFKNPQAVAINDSGAVLGFEYDAGLTDSHGFMVTGNVITRFDPPSSTSTFPSYITDKGTIAGSYNDSSGDSHGFILSGGTYTTIDVIPGSPTNVNWADDFGDTAGSYQVPAGPFGAAYTAGFFDASFGEASFSYVYPGSNYTTVLWTNIDTTIGNWVDASFNEHGFVQVNDNTGGPGTYFALTFPGASNTSITAVNAAGNFTGYFLDGSGTKHGFVAVCPTPGPACTQ